MRGIWGGIFSMCMMVLMEGLKEGISWFGLIFIIKAEIDQVVVVIINNRIYRSC
jgi:hypothetical protein